MQVALVTYSTRPRGSVVHTLSLAEALARRGESVSVFALRRGEGLFRAVCEGVRVREVELPTGVAQDLESRVLASIAALAGAVSPSEFDVVHAQDCIAANAVPGCVRTVHHLDEFTSPVLVRCHERALAEPSAHVCVSRAVARELRTSRDIVAEVIPNGVDAERFAAAASPSGQERRDRWLAALGGGEIMLAVGGIEPRKGSLELLEAFALLSARRPALRLVIAGGETLFDYRPYREAFTARTHELGVAPTILGPVEHERLPALMAAADVFVMPSTREGFGLAALEALAAGTPVVLSDLPIFREVFADSVLYGVAAPGLARAIERALDVPDAGRLACGRRLARAHTWESCAQAHQRLYRRIARRIPSTGDSHGHPSSEDHRRALSHRRHPALEVL